MTSSSHNPFSTTRAQNRVGRVLNFWFGKPNELGYGHYRKVWFIKNSDFDQQIKARFLADVENAASGQYDSWQFERQGQLEGQGAIALLLLLDQFPRNLYRGSAQSFATDPQALKVAQRLVSTGVDKALPPAYRFFAYLPFEHSERLEDQHQCINLMQQLIADFPNLDKGLKGGLEYAIRHRAVIERFGRFPHRNEILGRQSTPEEIEFLKQPGSRF